MEEERDVHGSAIVWWLREKGILPKPKEKSEKDKLPKWVKTTRDLLIISAILSLLTADILGLIISIIWAFVITSKKRIVVWLFIPFILLMNLYLFLLFPLFAIIRILAFLPLAFGLIKQLGAYYTEDIGFFRNSNVEEKQIKKEVKPKSKIHKTVNILFYGLLFILILLIVGIVILSILF